MKRLTMLLVFAVIGAMVGGAYWYSNQQASGASVAIVATDRAGSYAALPLPTGRALVMFDRSQARSLGVLPIDRALLATTRAQTQAGSTLPVTRGLVASAFARSQVFQFC